MYGSIRAQTHSELIRLKNSSPARFSLVGLIFGFLTVLLSSGSRAAGLESASFSWQVMYFTALAGPLMMLLGSLVENRDAKARNGGLLYRGVSPVTLQLFRLIGAALISGLFQIFSFGVIVILAGAPLSRAITAAIFSWIGSLGLIAIGAAVARWTGSVGAIIFGVVWQEIGMRSVETNWWYFSPPAWPIRILLAPTGVNASGTPINPDHPVLKEPSWIGVTECLGLGILMYAIVSVSASRIERAPFTARLKNLNQGADKQIDLGQLSSFGKLEKTFERRNPPKFPLKAVFLAQRGSGIIPLIALTLAIVLGLALSYDEDLASQIFTFFIFPMGAGLLPVLTWRLYSQAHIQLHLHNSHSFFTFLWLQTLYMVVTILGVAVIIMPSGIGVKELLMRIALWIVIGTVILNSSTALVSKIGVGAALATTLLVAVTSLTLGGDSLSYTSLWLVAVSAWPEIAIDSQRFWPAILVSLGLLGMSYGALTRTISRVRRAS